MSTKQSAANVDDDDVDVDGYSYGLVGESTHRNERRAPKELDFV